jgi:ABC-type glycerol-3-phosphate transport system substrate-binding protein
MYVMFYNKDMLKNYAELIEPSQHVDDGTWTMETMLAMTSGIYNDLNNNQKADKDDTFGFTSLNWHFDAIYYGCGMTMLEKDADPAKLLKIADDWTSEKAITLSDTVGEWIKKGDAYLDSTNYANIFVNGSSLLVMARHHDIASIISKAGFKYGIVPMPKYDKEQEKHITCVGNPVSLYSIYTLSKDANRAAAVLECWASEAYRTTTPAVFETTFKLRLSETSTESRMYDIIRSGVTFDLCRFFNRQLSSMGSEWYKCATTAGNWASKSEALMKSVPAKLQDIADSFNKIGN